VIFCMHDGIGKFGDDQCGINYNRKAVGSTITGIFSYLMSI
jgi:hypothetical protein